MTASTSRRERIKYRGPIDPENLPKRVDRRDAAVILTQKYGPVSPRTLERWPLVWVLFNGKATAATDDLMAEAERRFGAAAAIRGGKATAAASATLST